MESEFGLSGYKGILDKELAELHRIIDEEGVGKDGETYVKLILEPPEVRSVEEIRSEKATPETRPQWVKRYVEIGKPGFIRRVLSSRYLQPVIWRRFYYKIKRLLPISKKKRKVYSRLTPIFKEAGHFLCLSETFWLEYKQLAVEFFSIEISNDTFPFTN